jgi:uncharacterized RDD family membrane protein YckC
METATILPLNTETITYPSLADRVQSTFIDAIVMVGFMLIAATVLEKYDGAPDWIRVALFFGIWAVYEPLCISLGGTIGNHLKGIRVRHHRQVTRKINFFQAFFRYGAKITLGWLSFLFIHTNSQKRALHDLVAGSVMIRK